MKLKKRIVLGVIFGTVAALWAGTKLPELLRKARLSEGKATLSSFVTAQKAFRQVYETFSVSSENIGFHPEGSLRGYLATRTGDIRPEDLPRIHKGIQPFFGREHFRVLYIMPEGILVGTEQGIQEAEGISSTPAIKE